MAPIAKPFHNLTTPEWEYLKAGWGGPSNFMQSYGYKTYDFEECAEAEGMLKEMFRLDGESQGGGGGGSGNEGQGGQGQGR
ncbi:MAG: hypothetical protein M1831_001084 [Alyxoria varia]|nr:MAG: hypothetical protein M1831_001084 [Alyxoria varia]